MTMLDMKVKHFNLNLDYPYTDIIVQTNNLLNSQINDFIYDYLESSHNYKTFIIEYQDDLISVICYRMLKSLLNITDFNLLICGKHRKTKKYLDKKQKFISKRKMKKLQENGDVLNISVFNPLYNVVESDKIFNDFPNTWEPMRKFTPDEIKQAQVFYHIGYIKNDIIDDKRTELFSEWIRCSDRCKPFDYNPYFVSNDYDYDKIHVIRLTDNVEHNGQVLNEVEYEEGIFIYEIINDNEHHDFSIEQQLREFAYYLKNKSNTYGYLNRNIDPVSIAVALNVEIVYHEYKEDAE